MSTAEFNEIIISNRSNLQPFAIKLTRDLEYSKDLLQETLYKALANREKYEPGTNINAWLYTIMRNIFINDYRRKVKQKTIFDHSDNNFLIDAGKEVISNSAEGNLQRKEIENAIQGLPDIFRIPFLLYFEGFKYQEIAERLNEPLGTIKSRIHIARKLLKEQIQRN